jgi:RES domain-containing protein
LAAAAAPLSGLFYRSAEWKFAHPKDVLSGEGTRAEGGRYVPAGFRAVYGSTDEQTILREVTERKKRLGGRTLIEPKDYPRITHRFDARLERHVGKRSSP